MSDEERTSKCPHCGVETEVTGDPHVDGWIEVEHMQAEHPDIIVERLRSAGMHQEADAFERERAGPKDYAGIFEDVAGVLDRRDPVEMTAMAEAMRIHARQERER